MDTISHALWGGTIVRRRPLVWWALFFGAAPDLISSGPGAAYLLAVYGRFWSTDTWWLLPAWIHYIYHFAHSLLGAGAVLLILWLIGKKWLILILPYLLHLLIDYLTHSGDTLFRIFFPLVKFNPHRPSGIDWWTHWWIMAINIGLLLLVNLYLWFLKNRRRR